MTEDDYMSLEKNLKDQKVQIEVQGSSKNTILYFGTYQGTGFIGSKEVIILENTNHFNKAGISNEQRERTRAKTSYIDLENIISIDLDYKWDK